MIYRGAARRDLLIKLAQMYYLENLSQQQIANKIKTSRSNVSKMLQTARSSGIVQIRIDHASTPGFLLQTELMETFNLKQAVVIPSLKDSENSKMEAGRAAAELLRSKIADGTRIGIAWGTTVYHVVHQFTPKQSAGAVVYQLLGGTGAADPDTDGRELAQLLAAKLSAKSRIIQAPLIVQSKKLREMLQKEPEISKTLKAAEKADIVVTGIGTNNPVECTLAKVGYLSDAQAGNLQKAGAVGTLCGWHLDIHGQLCDLEIHERIVGIRLEKLKKIKSVIGVAHGAVKAESILACLRGGYINYLVTDVAAAEKVLDLNR